MFTSELNRRYMPELVCNFCGETWMTWNGQVIALTILAPVLCHVNLRSWHSTMISLPMITSTLWDATNKVFCILWDSCTEAGRDVLYLSQWCELLSSGDARTSISSCILCKTDTIDKSAHLAWCFSAGSGPWSALRALRIRVLQKDLVWRHRADRICLCAHVERPSTIQSWLPL